MKKGQSPTEYLIILAVVIIVALIVVTVMGGFPKPDKMDRDEIAEEMCGELDMVYLRHGFDSITCEKHYGSGIANETVEYHVDWDALEGLYGWDDNES